MANVRITVNEALNDGGIVRPPNENRSVGRFGEGTCQDQVPTAMGFPRQRQMRVPEGGAPSQIIVDQCVLQQVVTHALSVYEQRMRIDKQQREPPVGPLDTVRMPPTDDQPWSPFPVQDWSTLPADPLGSVSVNPTWPPPKPQRSWWRPLIVFGVVAALVAGAAFVANSVGVAGQVTAAADYLPSDGAVSYERTDTTRERKSKVGIAVTESARLSGVADYLAEDDAHAAVQEPA